MDPPSSQHQRLPCRERGVTVKERGGQAIRAGEGDHAPYKNQNRSENDGLKSQSMDNGYSRQDTAQRL